MTTNMVDSQGLKPLGGVSTRSPKRVSNLVPMIWEKFQNIFKVFLVFSIGFTLFYVVAVSLPKLIGHHAGAPIFKHWPQINQGILLFHIFTAIPPLLLGMAGFSKRIRKRKLKYHRWIGLTYCYFIWASASTGILLGMANTMGILSKAGFSCLGIAWFSTTWLAYKQGRARKIPSHREWMIRSYALTLAVVSIRPLYLFGPFWGLDVETWYVVCTWLCWVPNLIVAEAYIRSTTLRGTLRHA